MTPEQRNRTFSIVRNASAGESQSLDLSQEDLSVQEEVRQRLDQSIGLSGLTVGHYVIENLLGRGAFGEVYRGQDTTLGRAVALKFLIPERRQTGQLLAEAQAASALNHPNIVTVYEVLNSESGPVMVMEFIEGSSLRKLLASPVSPGNAQRYAVQLLEALSAAHRAGIVHRDLKPENLIVRPDGYLKVLDFGLARQTPQEQGALSLVGTLRYMSPEQCLGQPATPASDMFAAGLIFYEMACGRHAFGEGTPAETARAILRQEPKPQSIRGPLMKVARGLLPKDPAKRLSADEALKLLRVTRRWRWAVATAALVLVLLSAGFWRLRDRNSAPKPLMWSNLTSAAAEGLTAGSVSPDGSQYVFADREGVIRQLFIVGTNAAFNTNSALSEIGQIANQRVDRLTWLGRQPRVLLSSRDIHADKATGVLSIVDLANHQIRQLSLAGRNAVASPDGSRLAYTSVDGQFLEIAAFEPLHVLCRIRVEDPAGVKGIVWSPSGSLLHYWTIPGGRLPLYLWKSSVLHTVEARTGRLLLAQKMPAIVCAVMLQDGRLLYEGNESSNVSEVSVDPASGRLVGPFHLLGKLIGMEANLSASADGRTVVGISLRRSVTFLHVGDLDSITHRLGNVRALSDSSTEAFPHAWTPDNSAVIYESSRFGTQDLFRQPINGKRAERIVALPDQQVMANLSPDGKFVVFLSGPIAPSPEGVAQWKLMRMALPVGPILEVPATGPVQEFKCEYRAAPCVVREYRGGEMIFSALDPLRGKGNELLRVPAEKPAFGDWALSPDARKVTLLDTSRYPAAIRILDLDHGTEQRVELEGPMPAGGVASWSMDEKGWFLAQERDRMMFYDRQGSSHFVAETGHWLLPSWDGKKVAFTERDPDDADGYIAQR